MVQDPRTITVAAGQICARLMNEAPATLADIEAAIDRAAHQAADLLVLPECAYPAYLLGSITSYRAGDHLSSEAFVAWLGERAARRRLHVISGFVEDTGDALFNAAIFIDDRGGEIGRSRKRFLWQADHEWFNPGSEIRAFDSAIGRVGIVICAEPRAPEIVATLLADGAELIAMPTCWINAAAKPGQFVNPQVEFLVEARAREFGVPFVCADKWGMEWSEVGYVGQSRIVRADGSLAAEAPATGDAVITSQLHLCRPRAPQLTDEQRIRLLSDQPPVRPPAKPAEQLVVAVIPTCVANAHLADSSADALLKSLCGRGVGLLMVNAANQAQATQIDLLAQEADIQVMGYRYIEGVTTLGPARIGCVSGQEINSFAASRVLALDGAQVLAFFDMPDDLAMVRTRAMENGVFVMGANDRSAVVIDPDGGVLARTESRQLTPAVARIDLAQAADKLIAPQTDIFDERRVHLYHF